eukprot:scaffold11016_cov55-Attheya_sp.AAC.2
MRVTIGDFTCLAVLLTLLRTTFSLSTPPQYHDVIPRTRDGAEKVPSQDCRFSSRGVVVNRRSCLVGGMTVASSLVGVVLLPAAVYARERDVDVGGGTDITQTVLRNNVDAIYPASMVGVWDCARIVTAVEGDEGQAKIAWRCLGGTGGTAFAKERYQTKFVTAPPNTKQYAQYSFEGKSLEGVVLDRGFEMQERTGCSKLQWNVETPDILLYEREVGSSLELAVVRRRVELPSDQGFGMDELIKISTSSSGGLLLFGDSSIQRAIQVKRRYRRAFDDQGNRIVQ